MEALFARQNGGQWPKLMMCYLEKDDSISRVGCKRSKMRLYAELQLAAGSRAAASAGTALGWPTNAFPAT